MFNNSKFLNSCTNKPYGTCKERGEALLTDREYARLMITHTRGYLMPASYDTFVKHFPKLEDVAKSVASQLKGF